MCYYKVKIEAYAKYYNPQSTSSNLNGFALALTAAFGVTSSSTGEALKAFNTLNSYGGIIAGSGGEGSMYPKLFVNILLFDKDFKLVDAAWQQIDGGEQVGVSPKAAHDYMMQEVDIKEAGYAYIYVSNENATLVEFYVDDVVITHTPSNIIQYNEYYPFGMQTANSWTRENTTGNSFLYNAGSELNTVSNTYETFFRGYDPALGRMMQVDPLASKYASLTSYNYSFNDPVYWNDPSGATPEYSQHMYDHWKLVDGIINVDQGGGGSGGLAHIPQYGFGGFQNVKGDAYAVRSGQMSAEEYAMKYGATIYQNGSFINGGEGFFYTVSSQFGVQLGYNFDEVVAKAQVGGYPLTLKNASLAEIMDAFRHAYNLTQRDGDYVMSQLFDASGVKNDGSAHRFKHVRTFKNGIKFELTLNTREAGTASGYDGRIINLVQPYYQYVRSSYFAGKGWDIDPYEIPTYMVEGSRGTIVKGYPYAITIYGDHHSNNRMASLYFQDLKTFESFYYFVLGK